MKTFLIYTRTPWEEAPRARHQFTEALSQFHRVIFVEANKKGLPKLEKRDEGNNLEIWTPFFPIDYRVRFRAPLINEYYQFWFLKQIGLCDYIVTFDHTAHILAKTGIPLIYYCNDDHIKSYGIPFLKNYFRIKERSLVKNSIACFATSDYILEKLKRNNNNSFLSLLGAPKTSFNPFRTAHLTPKIKVVLVGFINNSKYSSTLFYDLLTDKTIELHIIGSVNNTLKSQLEAHSNYYFHGFLKGETLHEVLRTMDVGIAPYDLDKQDEGRTSNKLWLYLANGLPVVVSEIKNIKNWQFPNDFVYKVQDNNQFKSAIIKAKENDSMVLKTKRHDFSQQNTWEYRVKKILQILEEI